MDGNLLLLFGGQEWARVVIQMEAMREFCLALQIAVLPYARFRAKKQKTKREMQFSFREHQ